MFNLKVKAAKIKKKHMICNQAGLCRINRVAGCAIEYLDNVMEIW